MSLSRWQGKVAVVTGSSAGIGAATCIELCKNGIITIGLARRVEKTEKLRENLTPEQNKIFHATKCDVSIEAEIIRTFAEIEKKFGAVDILINNAGVVPQSTSLDIHNSDDVHRIINTNLYGVIFCTREAVRIMKVNNTEGHIMHINSVGGHYMPFVPDFAGFGVYFASKHAMTALAEQHRQEFMRAKLDIKVTSLSPGAVRTDIFGTMNISQDTLTEMMNSMPFLESKDIADAVIYLLSTPPKVLVTELIIRPMNEGGL